MPYAGDRKRAIDESHWRQERHCAFQQYFLAAPIILDLVLLLNSAPGSRSKLKERGLLIHCILLSFVFKLLEEMFINMGNFSGQIPSAKLVAVKAGEHSEGLARENKKLKSLRR